MTIIPPQPPTSPRDVIECIRRYEFGIGASLEGDGQIVVDNLVRKYRNLLATIAEDLNSKESHFILELLQNADDNQYKVDVAPSLSFRLESNRLVVVNNEFGFTEENVKALCSAGESSKKNKLGYIGEKGIGFKSVFKVTDAPEIHSNGYHFQFNRSDPQDLLGYIVPHWKEASFPLDDSATTVVLPAKLGREFSTEMLSDLNATLLLFLDKLRHLEAKSGDKIVHYSREDVGAITTLSIIRASSDSGDNTTRSVYLRTKSTLDMSDIAEAKRKDVKTSDLVLAFPLSENGEAAPIPSCPTYAFLPIREFGFNFYIQGNFVLISSREGIHEDLPWNTRLRDAIAPAFVAALEQFKTRPALANSYLRFLPDEGDILDPFFKPVVKQIVDALKDVECIPVESGGWRKPTQVLLAPSSIHDLFKSEDVRTLFDADYPSPNFKFPSNVLVECIGCRSLLITDVVNVFSVHSKWLAKKDIEWKARFYVYLATSPNSEQFIKSMLTLPCLPTADGRMVEPEKTTVFYPLSTSQQYGFEQELTILDAVLYKKAHETTPEVKILFDSLMVKHDNPLELVCSHILKRHTGIVDAEQGALLGHVRYIRDKLDQYLAFAAPTQTEAAALQALRDGLFLGTKRIEDGKWYFDRPIALYLSKDYRPAFNIEGLLGTNISPGLLLSERYIVKLPDGSTDEDEIAADLERWRSFFVRIGVHKSPKVVKFDAGDVKCSDELAALLQSEDQSVQRATLECLDQNWSAFDSRTTYQVNTGRYSTATHQTQFAKQLRATKAPTKRRTIVSLDQAYHNVGDVKDILGGNITFVDASIQDVQFLKACGITYKVDAQGCLKRLRQIRAEGGSTRDQIRVIYRRLEQLWNTEQHIIKLAFTSEPLITVGRGDTTSWALPCDTCWRSTNVKFLDARHPPLQSQYVDHSTFFTKLLSVPFELPLDNWVNGLQALPTIENDRERIEVALTIYRRLSKELGQSAASAQPPVEPDWLARFRSHQALFLDHRGTLVPNSTTIFFNDIPDFALLFADVPSISLLAIPHEQISAVASLFNKVGVRTLSSELKVDVAPGINGNLNEALTQKLREMFGCIARVVYGQSHERFETAVRDKLFDALRQFEVLEVSDLALDVSLGSVSRRTTGDIALKGNQLLLRADAPSHVDYVAMEVRKLLRLPQALSDTISRLLLSPTVKDAEAFLHVRNFSALPPEEAKAIFEGEPAEQPEEVSPAPDLEATTPRYSSATVPVPAPTAVGGSGMKPAAPQAGDSPTLPPASFGSGMPVSSPMGTLGSTPSTRPEPTNGATNTPSSSLPFSPRAADGHSSSPGATRLPGTDSPIGGNTTEVRPPSSSTSGAFAPRGGTFDYIRSSAGKRKRSGKTRPMRTTKGRLLSYAEPNGSAAVQPAINPESDQEASKHRSSVEQAAVKFFLETAADQWKSLEEMPHHNPGFDVKAVAFDGTEEVIEVKGQGGAWTEEGVSLTPTELVKAHSMRSRYWLCVVEYATDDNRRQLSLIRDPFGLTNQFRFDNRWKAMALTVAARPQRPDPGMFVHVPGEGKGQILKVKGNSRFTKLHIKFEDGRQVFSKVFNPATMTLSFD